MRPRRHKYGAVKTEVDGVVFASQAEARRYAELRLLEKAGEICQLAVQPTFDLFVTVHTVGARLRQTAQKLQDLDATPERVKVGRYVADFSYRRTADMQRVVEDVKGFKTPLYRWKKKHVEAQYGIQVHEIVAKSTPRRRRA